MRRPKRAINRGIRTRSPKRRDRLVAEIDAVGWPAMVTLADETRWMTARMGKG
jgi:hypothetical protein